MTTRYGDKTRVTQGVPGWGRSSSTASAWIFYEQVFTSPGTWTKPATVSFVDVLVVGAGGGGGCGYTRPATPQPATGIQYGFGGGGGGGLVLYIEGHPVSGPVPITVGAGGTGGQVAGPDGTGGATVAPTAGGDSAFGPIAAPVPANTIRATGGGGGGSAGFSVPLGRHNPQPQTPAGSLGGQARTGPSPVGAPLGSRAVCYPTSLVGNVSGTPGDIFPGGSATGGGGFYPGSSMQGGAGLYGFGGGGGGQGYAGGSGGGRGGSNLANLNSTPEIPATATPGEANTGGGGGGGGCTTVPVVITVPTPNFAGNGGNGGSGIVVVGWWERA